MKWGPTWTNTLPLRIVYLTTEEGRARLRPFLQPGNVDKAGGAPVNAVLAVDNSYHRYIPRLLPFRPEMADALERDSALHHRIQHSGGWSGWRRAPSADSRAEALTPRTDLRATNFVSWWGIPVR